MNSADASLGPGLFLVATPIGNARDITLRALDVLAAADVLVAEDTRTLQKLLQLHGIARNGRQMIAYHDHSGPGEAGRLADLVRAGQSLAYSSEAGTPLVSDPGYALVTRFAAEGLPVTVVPGPSAALAALSLAGLPTDRFLFVGFAPARAAARQRWIGELAARAETLILYESPRRLPELLDDLVQGFGGERRAALCRELTKRFETVLRGTLDDLVQEVAATPPRGECVLVLAGAGDAEIADDDVRQAVLHALERLSLKDAVQEVAQTLGVPRKTVYQIALTLKDAPGNG